MLKRLLNVALVHKRFVPVVETRYIAVNSTNNDEPKQSDDIVDNIEQFANKICVDDNLPKSTTVVPILVDHLNCTPEVAEKIVKKNEDNFNLLTLSELTHQLQLFLNNGIDKEVLLQFPEIILMPPSIAQQKLEVIKEFCEGKNGGYLNDYVPLMRLPIDVLKDVKKEIIKDRRRTPFGSRIHMLSKIFSVEPYVVSTIFSNYSYLWDYPLRNYQRNAILFLQYNLSVDNIFKDPCIFRFSAKRIRRRLEQAKKIKGVHLMPWMIHCPARRLENSLKISAATKEVLEEANSVDTISFLSKRLGIEQKDMFYYAQRCPQIFLIRISKIKSIIDYLLDEAGYSPIQIATMPRVLTFPLERVKERHEVLKELGQKVFSLSMFCTSISNFNKYVEKIKKIQGQQKMEK